MPRARLARRPACPDSERNSADFHKQENYRAPFHPRRRPYVYALQMRVCGSRPRIDRDARSRVDLLVRQAAYLEDELDRDRCDSIAYNDKVHDQSLIRSIVMSCRAV